MGIAELKEIITQEAAGLEQMGMPFNLHWKEAQDELLALDEPRISYQQFTEVCTKHGLEPIDAETLIHLLHDLGYIVYYSDDERLRDDIILQPDWLTKAISFVLEDRTTQEMDGILPDGRLHEVWRDHPFKGETRYPSSLYPFFLRLMEKYDVSYRLLEGTASLVAQHVPQVRPDLPWLPDQVTTSDLRRIAMICSMDEEPPGLVPWMIVRTHKYAIEYPDSSGESHRLHWQKGMFLTYRGHATAMLEKRGREFHTYVQAVYPKRFLRIIHETLRKLFTDNWPGLTGHYRFMIPCQSVIKEAPCAGRFPIEFLHRSLEEAGQQKIRCQTCFQQQDIEALLFGFEKENEREELARVQLSVDRASKELQEAIISQTTLVRKDIIEIVDRVDYSFMAIMHAIADEAKQGPRLFTIEPVDEGRRLAFRRFVSTRLQLQLWCEAVGCQHQVFEEGVGVYEFDKPYEWVRQVVPYANFVLGLLKTVLPVAVPAVDVFFGKDTVKNWDYAAHINLAKAFVGELPEDIETSEGLDMRPGVLSGVERSGLLAMHALLRELDPSQENLGLIRVATYTGDYRWLCYKHYEAWQPRIPDKIESPEGN